MDLQQDGEYLRIAFLRRMDLTYRKGYLLESGPSDCLPFDNQRLASILSQTFPRIPTPLFLFGA